MGPISTPLIKLGLIGSMMPLLLANSACDEVSRSIGLDPIIDTACGSGALNSYIGDSVWLVPSALVLDGQVRIIRPGDAVTMDYIESRLNISLNEDDEIVEVICG